MSGDPEYTVLLAGESWTTISFEIKGANVVRNSTYEEAAEYLVAALETAGATVDYQPCHIAVEQFPRTQRVLEAYDLVLLSDIGADSLQLTAKVVSGSTDVDRCELLADFVANGGALGMIGGYMSFAGKGGQARYAQTALADVLPVEIKQTDDRVEMPAGAKPQATDEVPAEIPDEWPSILGYNRLEADPDATIWATVNDDPLLVVGDFGSGSAFALATDCAPHWAPETFLQWNALPTLWKALLNRVAGN